MGFIRQLIGYVWGIVTTTLSVLQLLELLGIRPDDTLEEIGGGVGPIILSAANAFGAALDGIADWIVERLTSESVPPPCVEGEICQRSLMMSSEMESSLIYSQYGVLAGVAVLSLLIFFMLVRR